MNTQPIIAEELRQDFESLRTAGFSPKLCDTAVPLVDVPVLAGYPGEAGDSSSQKYVMLPRDLVGSHPTFLINAMGDSMCDIGITDGDTLEVQMGGDASDGDVVVAEVDGGFTVKTFFRDANGILWLVPENDAYNAIRLTGRQWRILGRVKGIRKGVPRSAFNSCAKTVLRTQQAEGRGAATGRAKRATVRELEPRNMIFRRFYNRRPLDFATIRDKIEQVIVRQMRYRYEWYAAYRVLMDLGLLEELQLSRFAQQMQEWFPDIAIQCTADSMGEYAVGHTSCGFALWDSTRFREERRKGQSVAGFNTLYNRCGELRAALFPVPVLELDLPF